MRKNVVIINDELGAMALGFSKAGYNISAIYVDWLDEKSVQTCKENWKKTTQILDLNCLDNRENTINEEVDFIAGKISFGTYSVAYKVRKDKKEDITVSQAVRLMKEKRPKYFLFQCNRIDDKNCLYNHLYDNIKLLGYTIGYNEIHTRAITGLPVEEKRFFLYGSLDSRGVDLKSLKNIDTLNYLSDFLCNDQEIKDEWYYRINSRYIENLERSNYNAVFSWDGKKYKKNEFVKLDIIHIPLIVCGDSIRKITHKEVARLKGIPDEYYLYTGNKGWLYEKLFSCSNVQLIQQIVTAISIDTRFEQFQRRQVFKGQQFEKIIISFLEQKGANSDGIINNVDLGADFQIRTVEQIYYFDFKIYHNNYGIEDRVIAVCEKINSQTPPDNRKNILVIGNIVGEETKKRVEDKFNIFIWDVENLLWMFDEFPQIKSDFISLLSFSVSDIVPKEPKPYIFEKSTYSKDKVDLQEKLRMIQPGREDAYKYEKLCEEIMRYLFSADLEFFDAQRESNGGLYRFDYYGKIKHGNCNEFFDTIKNFFRTKYIIFEFKNYVDEITQKEIYTTEKYLYEKALRKVAIIISRKGVDENGRKAARGSLREYGKLIICLSDESINKLIDMKKNKEEPGDFLEAILDNMLMDLEK